MSTTLDNNTRSFTFPLKRCTYQILSKISNWQCDLLRCSMCSYYLAMIMEQDEKCNKIEQVTYSLGPWVVLYHPFNKPLQVEHLHRRANYMYVQE